MKINVFARNFNILISQLATDWKPEEGKDYYGNASVAVDESGITKASSAYLFFSKEMSSKIRDELEAEGKESNLGAVVAIVSSRVRDDFSKCFLHLLDCL